MSEQRETYREFDSNINVLRKEPAAVQGTRKLPTPIPFNGLLTNKILTALPGENLAHLLPNIEPVAFVAGHDVYRFGEPVDFIYFPETTVISHVFFLEDGSSTAAAMVGNEGMVGLSTLLEAAPPPYNSHVTLGGTAVRIRPEIIKQEFSHSGPLRELLFRYMSRRMRQLSQIAVCNSRHHLENRLCTWLLMLHDRSGRGVLPLTHEEIAGHLGARRAGITNACNALRDRRVITYRRGLIRVLDRPLLEECACECYRSEARFH